MHRPSWSPVRWRAEAESKLLNTEEITARWEKQQWGCPMKIILSCKVHQHVFFVIRLEDEKTKASAIEVLDLEA